MLLIQGTGLYDASTKRVILETSEGQNEIVPVWDSHKKGIKLKMQNDTLDLDPNSQAMKQPVKVKLTLNNQEWIDALEFKYHDLKVERLEYVSEDLFEGLETEEEKTALWRGVDPAPEVPEEEPTEEEVEKKKEEELKRQEE